MANGLVVLSGLPRSGSTVLTSLLNQHPKLYATTTSPILGMVLNFYHNWEPQTNTQIKDKDERQRTNMVAAMIHASHAHIDKQIFIDKNRGWPKNGKLLTELLGKQPKMICTVRNIPDIMASFITLANKDPDNFIDKQLKESGFTVNNTNRCRMLWQSGVVGQSWQAFKSGWNFNKNNLLIIEYDDIVSKPLEVMKRIEDYLEIEHFEYDINNLSPMEEKDEFHGIKNLHEIRPVVKKTSKPPEQIIGVELTNWYNDMKLNFWKNEDKHE